MRQILKNTWRILNQGEKKRFSVLILFDILITLLDILSLVVLLVIIQFYIQPGNNTGLPFLQQLLRGKDPVTVIIYFLVFFALKNLFAFFITTQQYKFIADVSVRISAKNLSRFQHADFDEFIHTDSSVHIRRIGFQPLEFCQHLLSGVQQIITQSFLIFISVLAIIIFDAQLFLLLLAVLLPPVIIVFFFIKRKLSALKLVMQSSNEKTFRSLYDSLKGYVESNIYNRHDFFMKRFVRHRAIFSKKLFSSIAIQSLPNRIIETFAVLGLFILMLIAEWNGDASSATFITIGAFLAAAYKIIPGVVKVINISGQIRAFETSLAEIAKDRTEIYKSSTTGGKEISTIQFRDVNFHFGSNQILKNFQFCITKGEMVGITGNSGRGKTT
ncbi:MAG: ABC transporter transmembrane domain-containing protein, partial [Flavisolibacter sp.]